jgi:hypothetical protein
MNWIKTWISWGFKASLHFQLRNRLNRTVYFVDLDNTLADTWPVLKRHRDLFSRKRTKERLAIPAFAGARNLLKRALHRQRLCFIVSARPYPTYFDTLSWLRQNEIVIPRARVILVSHPHQKLELVRMVLKRGFRVVVLDDLTYNHEHGEVLSYDGLIEDIRSLGVRYYGAEFIRTLIAGR